MGPARRRREKDLWPSGGTDDGLGRAGDAHRGRGHARVVEADGPLLAPDAHGEEDAVQLAALVGEAVLDADGALGVDGARDEAARLQLAQVLAEDLGADAADGALELVEAHRRAGQLVEDDEVPLLADDLG